MNLQFSEISTTGKIPENKDNLSDKDFKLLCCAHALNDWGCIHAGSRPPENFGHGMAAVGKLLGVLATGDFLMKYAEDNSNGVCSLLFNHAESPIHATPTANPPATRTT